MKKIYTQLMKTLAVMAVMLLMGACAGFLDEEPLSERTVETFYKTEAHANEALFAIYDVLQWNFIDTFHPPLMVCDIASDDAYKGGSNFGDRAELGEIGRHQISTMNLAVEGLWRKGYAGIYRANQLLSKIDGMNASDEFKKRIAAEAKFLRAYFYLELVRFFENVPLILEVLDHPDKYIQSNSAGPVPVYNQIAADLEDAAENLTTNLFGSGNTRGRATRWSAKALLARAYLFYNGVYGGDLQAGNITVDKARVRQHLVDVIGSGHALVDYGIIFTKAGDYSTESVFDILHSDVNPGDWGFVRGTEGNIQAQMQGFREMSGNPELEPAWGFAPVTIGLYNAYEPNDPRRDYTIISQENLVGTFDIGFQHTGYFSRKYTTLVEFKGTGAGEPVLNWQNHFRIIRFADVLLMAAELYLDDDPGTAAGYLNMVRNRVGLPSKNNITLDDIYHERRVEFGLEGLRYWDLLRRDKALDYASSRISFTATESNKGPFYQGNLSDYNVTFRKETKGFFPIPQREIEMIGKNNLLQNSGY